MTGRAFRRTYCPRFFSLILRPKRRAKGRGLAWPLSTACSKRPEAPCMCIRRWAKAPLSTFTSPPPPGALDRRMKSMTGYGRGECAEQGFKITLEVSSVNRKQTEIAVNLPRDLEVLEAQIRDEINRRVARGRVTVRVSVHAAEGAAGQMRINSALAKIYAKELRALAGALKVPGDVTLDMIARAPGVLQPMEIFSEAEEVWPALADA